MFFFSSRRRHTRCGRDWSSDVCSSDLAAAYSTQAVVDARNEYAAAQAGDRDKTADTVKKAAGGAVVGAAGGAAGGAHAARGEGAGEGGAVGGGAGAGGGPPLRPHEKKKDHERDP